MTLKAPTVILPAPMALAPLRGAGVPVRLSDRVLVLESVGRHGLWCTTKGLGEFGLPELQTLDVPPPIGVDWARTLTGIALVVVEHWIDALRDMSVSFIELPSVIEVTPGHVARAYGMESQIGGASATVQLRLDPASDFASDSFLTVEPPDGASEAAGSYLARVCAAVLAPLESR